MGIYNSCSNSGHSSGLGWFDLELLCGKSRRMISPGFGNTVSDHLCTLSVVLVYITDLVLQYMTDRANKFRAIQ